MEDKKSKNNAGDANGVEVLGATYETGKPEDKDLGRWRQKLSTRDDKLKYLMSGERYWYSQEWYGSEKRKNPA